MKLINSLYISKTSNTSNTRNTQSSICTMLSLSSHKIEDARTLLERVLETQKQISESFICKEPDVQYYGWYSEEIQSRRLEKPIEYKLRPSISRSMSIISPPYTYWLQGDKKILVTDVTLTPEAMKRHIDSNAVFLGKLDEFGCRSYTKL